MSESIADAKRVKGTALLLQRVSESAGDLAKDAALALQGLRQEAQRADKKKDAVMAILQQSIDVRGQMKRFWPLLTDADQNTLREFGFRAPSEDK